MTLLTGHEIMTIHILSNISRSIDNQAMQFDQIIEYNVKNLFFFLKKALQKIKARGHHLSLNIFQWITSWTENKKKFITFQAVDTRIYSILVFYKRIWDQLLQLILCMIFEKKYFSVDVINFEIYSFLIKSFSHMIKKSHNKHLNIFRRKRAFNMK